MNRQSPHVTSHIQYPYPVDRVVQIERSIALVMGNVLWFFSPFVRNREVGGVPYVEYRHKEARIVHACGIYLDSETSTQVVPNIPNEPGNHEFNLLIVDDHGVFHVIDPSRQLSSMKFRVRGVAGGDDVRDMAGSLEKNGEFALLTHTETRIIQLDKRRVSVCFETDQLGTSVIPFGDGYLVNMSTNLWLIRDNSMREFLHDDIVDQFVVDGETVVTFVRRNKQSQAAFTVVRGQSFSIKGIKERADSDARIFDVSDTFFVAYLPSTVVVVNICDTTRRIQAQLPHWKEFVMEPVQKVICGVRDCDLIVQIFSAKERKNSIIVELPLELIERDEYEEEEEYND